MTPQMELPPFKKVGWNEFQSFLNKYPRPLSRYVSMIYEPPKVILYDSALHPDPFQSVVAYRDTDGGSANLEIVYRIRSGI